MDFSNGITADEVTDSITVLDEVGGTHAVSLSPDDLTVVRAVFAGQAGNAYAQLWQDDGRAGESAADNDRALALRFMSQARGDASQTARILRFAPRFRAVWNEPQPDGRAYGAVLMAQATATYESGQSGGSLVRAARRFAQTDYGNAERLVHAYGQDFRYCPTWNTYLVWDRRRWAPDGLLQVERYAKDTIRRAKADVFKISDPDERKGLAGFLARSESARAQRAMVELAKSESGIPVTPSEFDRDPWLLNVSNGTVDLRTGRLREHRREDLITKLAPVTYDPAARCPTWDAFLATALPDPELRGYIQRIVGYCLTGSTKEHAMFNLLGPGANGKSTFANTIKALLGSYAKQAAPDLLMASQSERHPAGLADLQGARFVVMAELDRGKSWNESLLKQITGGDPIKARPLYGQFFEFQPTCKLVVSTNYLPDTGATDAGFWRRMKIIPFTTAIPEDQRDRDLGEKLKAELPGILNWAIEGCLAWQRLGGLGTPRAVAAATEEYRADQDVLAPFLAECCVVASGRSALSKDLYAAYVGWCLENDAASLSQNEFSRRLNRPGVTSARGARGVRKWLGVGLAETSGQGTVIEFPKAM